MLSNFTLPQLTPDKRPWRIDWLGNLAYKEDSSRRSYPSLCVAISPMRCSRGAPLTVLCSRDATDVGLQRQVWVPLGALIFLRIGDIWERGRLIASPRYQTEEFKDVIVDQPSTSFIKAGLSIQNEGFLLPLHDHPWHVRHTQSYCVCLCLQDGRRIIIPCIELIRFYFGSSSQLLHRLFSAELTPNMLWQNKSFNPPTGWLRLKLAQGIFGNAASDIGRIANSPQAWRAAAKIFSSCRRASVARELVYPCTGFPFEGKTTLKMSGVWLPLGDVPAQTFCVFRLRSCTHPFPFTSLTYFAETRFNPHASRRDRDSETSPRGSSFMNQEPSPQIRDSDPGRTKTPKTLLLTETRLRFPDLCKKKVSRARIQLPQPESTPTRRHLDCTSDIALGDCWGPPEVRQVDIAAGDGGTRIIPIDKIPSFAQAAYKTLAKKHPQLSQVILSGYSQPLFPLPELVAEDGAIEEITLYQKSNGTRRPRLAWVLAINRVMNTPYYMVIVEGSRRRMTAQTLSIDQASIDSIIMAIQA